MNILSLLFFLLFVGGSGATFASDSSNQTEQPDKSSYSELTVQLESEDGNSRRKAAEMLAEYPSADSVEVLSKAYKAVISDGFGVKAAIAVSLGKIGREDGVPTLSAMLDDSDYWVRRKAAQALGSISGEKAVETLYKALKDQDPRVRADAVLSLGKKKAGLDKIKKALKDEDERVAAAAYTAIDAIQDDGAREILAEALSDENWIIRYRAASLLAQRDDQRGFDVLEKAIKKGINIGTALREASCIGPNIVPLLAELFSDPEVQEKAKILKTIEKLDCPASTEFFYKLFTNKNADDESRVTAGTVLFDRREELKGDWTKDVAEVLYEENPNLVAISLQFLQEGLGGEYISRIIPHASHENDVIRHFALLNLSEYATTEHEGIFIAALNDDKMINVRLALDTLERIGTQKAIDAIAPLAEERKTRRYADQAIEAIRERISSR